ncbi:MAG TPA: hypothetical protein VIL46_15485 [Gemmataceae bacterium]
MNRFPCPNPTCSFIFDPAQIPPGVTLLACPLCRTQFPYRPPAAAPSPYTSPPPPSSAKGLPAVSAAVPEGGADEPAAPLITAAPRKAVGGFFNSPLMYALFFLLLSGGLVTVYFAARTPPFGGGASGVFHSADLNFSYDPPGAPWVTDSEARTRLSANVLALHRPEPAAWAAIAAEDFRDRDPRPSELQAKLRARLRGYFRNLESQEIEGASWAGKEAIGYHFQGEADGRLMSGECYAIAHKGIGYWFIAWAPAETFAERAGELADLRARFRLGDGRADWAAARPAVQTFAPPGAAFRLADPEGVWRDMGLDAEQLKALDPHAVLMLETKKKLTTRTYVNPRAEVVVYEYPAAGGDPLRAARERLLERLKKEAEAANSEVSLHEVEEPARGEAGGLLRLREENSIDRDRKVLHVLAALEAGGKLIAAEARCDWRQREVWEPAMLELLRSLQATGAAAPEEPAQGAGDEKPQE